MLTSTLKPFFSSLDYARCLLFCFLPHTPIHRVYATFLNFFPLPSLTFSSSCNSFHFFAIHGFLSLRTVIIALLLFGYNSPLELHEFPDLNRHKQPITSSGRFTELPPQSIPTSTWTSPPEQKIGSQRMRDTLLLLVRYDSDRNADCETIPTIVSSQLAEAY